MLNLYRLQVWKVLVESGGVSAAARRLYLTQPAVSMHVRALEAEVGQSLLTRRGRGVVVTDAGWRVYDYACQVLTATDDLRTELAGGKDRAEVVRIALNKAVASDVVPRLARAASMLWPDREVQMVVTSTVEVDRLVAAGEVVCGVNLDYDRSPTKTLPRVSLYDDRLVIIAPPGCKGAREAEALPWVWPTGRCVFASLVRQHVPMVAPARHPIQVTLNDLEAIKAVVRGGHACALVPAGAVAREEAQGEMTVLPLSASGATLHYALIGPKSAAPLMLQWGARFRAALGDWLEIAGSV